MKPLRAAVLLLTVPLLAACSSASTGADAAPDSAAVSAVATSDSPSPVASCSLPNTRDLIVRMISPNLPPSSEELGEVDYSKCASTLDTLGDTSPTDPGYCTQVAWASDNPAYKADTTPAPPLKKIIEQFGPAC